MAQFRNSRLGRSMVLVKCWQAGRSSQAVLSGSAAGDMTAGELLSDNMPADDMMADGV